MKKFIKILIFTTFFMLSGCGENQSIVNNVGEKEANEIVVFLASKGIESQKMQAASSQTGGGSSEVLWSITVDPNKAVEAMAFLNKQGLPRKKGTSLLDLFAKTGLMSSDKEETIRYQAGIEEELKNIITKIDGIIDCNVQISFPTTESLPGATPSKAKASVYVKHQGVFDDPNNHLETKIKRLLSGAVENLNFEDVSVISDKSKLTDISVNDNNIFIGGKAKPKEYVKIWSIVMTKSSAQKFKTVFFTFTVLILIFGSALGWMIYKHYPFMKKTKKDQDESK